MFFALLASALATVTPPPPPPIKVPPPPIRTAIITPTPRTKEFEQNMRWANACRRTFIGQDYHPQPAIWKIADADTTLYLLGTVHLLPLGFDWRSAQLDQIVALTQDLFTEVGLNTTDVGIEGQAKLLERLGGGGALPPIAARVTGERRATWLGMAALMPDGVPEQIDRMPNWLAAMAIGKMVDKYRAPTGTMGVDQQLTNQFKKAGKKITALEKPESVTARMNNISQADQMDMLTSVLDAVARPRPMAQRVALFHNWAKGQPSKSLSEILPGASFADDLQETLLTSRNAAWVEVIKRRMDAPGTTLIAAGAAHFWGEGSVVDLLARQGIVAERVSPTAAVRQRAKFAPVPATWKECDLYMFGRKVPVSESE
jgi:uncharacterized protein YbaP (TraB family)